MIYKKLVPTYFAKTLIHKIDIHEFFTNNLIVKTLIHHVSPARFIGGTDTFTITLIRTVS